MRWLAGLVAAGAAFAALRRASGTFVLGDRKLAGERDTPQPRGGAVAAKKVCTEEEKTQGELPIIGTRSWLIWGNCTRRCCNLVIRTYCDENGENCVNMPHYEDCAEEGCGSYIGISTKASPA
jgi:hypothetical protein